MMMEEKNDKVWSEGNEKISHVKKMKNSVI